MTSHPPGSGLTIFGRPVLRSPSASAVSSQIDSQQPRLSIEELSYARTIVTPKNISPSSESTSDLIADEFTLGYDIDWLIDLEDFAHADDTCHSVDDVSMDADAPEGDSSGDLVFSALDDASYMQAGSKSHMSTAGKSVAGSRAKARHMTSGERMPRAPHGRGKAPALITHTRTERQQQAPKMKVLNGLRQNRQAAKKKAPRRSPPKITNTPVGTKDLLIISEQKEPEEPKKDEFCIPEKPFQRVVRDISVDLSQSSGLKFKWTKSALEVLQRASEEHCIKELAKWQQNAEHADRRTVPTADSALTKNIRSKNKPYRYSIDLDKGFEEFTC